MRSLCKTILRRTKTQAEPTLSVSGLELERGERLLFRKLAFEVRCGMVVRLAGPNGSGKTSLLKVLTGLMSADAGEIRYCGELIGKLKEDYCRNLVYIGHLNGIKDDLTALENLSVNARLGSMRPSADEMLAALSKVGLEEFSGSLAGELSQGQRRRVALARLFLSQSKPLWILDEPFVALDVDSVRNLAQAVSEHAAADGIVIYTTHQQCPLNVPPARCVTVDVSAFAPKVHCRSAVHV